MAACFITCLLCPFFQHHVFRHQYHINRCLPPASHSVASSPPGCVPRDDSRIIITMRAEGWLLPPPPSIIRRPWAGICPHTLEPNMVPLARTIVRPSNDWWCRTSVGGPLALGWQCPIFRNIPTEVTKATIPNRRHDPQRCHTTCQTYHANKDNKVRSSFQLHHA